MVEVAEVAVLLVFVVEVVVVVILNTSRRKKVWVLILGCWFQCEYRSYLGIFLQFAEYILPCPSLLLLEKISQSNIGLQPCWFCMVKSSRITVLVEVLVVVVVESPNSSSSSIMIGLFGLIPSLTLSLMRSLGVSFLRVRDRSKNLI